MSEAVEANGVVQADELERLADELHLRAGRSARQFEAFLDEVNEPLNVLRRIAGKPPRHIRDVVAERRRRAAAPAPATPA